MKKNIKHILPILFVLSLGFVSCSQMELDVKEETPETTEEEVWTLKVEAGAKSSADTKALSLNDNGTIKSEWVQNDVIIAYKYLENGMLYLSEPVGSLTAETSGLHTTFTGSLTSVEGLATATASRSASAACRTPSPPSCSTATTSAYIPRCSPPMWET